MRGNSKSELQLIDESRRAGRRLAMALHQGASPHRVPTRLALRKDEFCAGEIPVHIYQFLEGDGAYTKRSGGWMIGGGLIGAVYSAVNVTSNVVGNAARRAQAAREAAGRWRHVDTATIYLTDQRWSVRTSTSWYDLWFSDVRMSDCDGKMITLDLAGMPRTGLVLPDADYWFVMFTKLAYDRVVMPPPPSDEVAVPGERAVPTQ
jgi:hypothetical protein